MEDNKKRKYMFIAGPLILLIALAGVTYAFFNYTRTGTSNTIQVGKISFNSNQTDTIVLTNIFPIASSEASGENPNYDEVVISISGDTTYNDGIEYLVSAVNVTNTINNKSVPISIEVIPSSGLGNNDIDYFDNRGGNDSINKVLAKDTIEEDGQLVVGYITKGATGVNGTITIKAYIDKDKIAISDTYPTENITHTESSGETSVEVIDYTNGTTSEWVNERVVLTTEEWNSLQNSSLSFKVKVEANEGIWVEEPLTGVQKVQRAITAKINAETNSCNPIWVDEEDGITYLSGTNECIDMNYVWYSGKLWRITAIYPDGSMKLITQNSLTNSAWGGTIEYNGSWIYQWLNEDFYDTLNNVDNIVNDAIWNYSMDTNNVPVRPESIGTQRTKEAKVGLINFYEYYNSYRNSGSYSTSYLNIGYWWWLLTQESSSSIKRVYDSGSLGGSPLNQSSSILGVRPSIVIKPGLEFVGDGTISSPYSIIGDKENPINNATLLNSRSSGEYVKFNNDIYRILEIDETLGTTKLISLNYLKDSNNEDITKSIASTVYYGKSTNTKTDAYLDYYLNNTWYNSISSIYKNMLVDSTYYLGYFSFEQNYKTTICKDANLNNVTVKNCTKYTSDDADKTFTGKVGIARVNEMFSAQQGSGSSSSNDMWTISPYSSSSMWRFTPYGHLAKGGPSTNYVVRPIITLKSEIKIVSGTGYVGGDTNSPFEISE